MYPFKSGLMHLFKIAKRESDINKGSLGKFSAIKCSFLCLKD